MLGPLLFDPEHGQFLRNMNITTITKNVIESDKLICFMNQFINQISTCLQIHRSEKNEHVNPYIPIQTLEKI